MANVCFSDIIFYGEGSMSLVTLVFLLFCVIVLGIYFIVPKKFQWIVLLISSLFFLFYKNFTILTIIQALIVILTSYIIGILIEKNKDNQKKNIYLIIGIVIILGVLFYLKYSNLFITTINHLFNTNYELVKRNSLVGISYYSLIMISYLIDIQRGSIKAQRNIFKCALFMSYFPILTSGPFIRYENIKDDLYGSHKFNYERARRGLLRVLIGVFKVLVISERLGNFVNTVYGNLNGFSGIYIFIAALLFTIQLYTNFSGSIDIIMGISEVMGINLPENFDNPFCARTITEFWRRWHITLGAWLKDYIFYPLLKSNFMQKLNTISKNKFGKKVGKKIPLYLSMLIMWTMIGIWHGGAYTYIIGSGLLQFLFMFLEDNLEPVAIFITSKLKINRESFGYKLYQRIRTYLLFSFSMIFFRAERVSEAFKIIKGIFVNHKTKTPFFNIHVYSGKIELLVFIFAIISLIVIEVLNRKGDIRDKILKRNIVIRWLVYYILIFAIMIIGCYGPGYDPATFIYRGF